MRKANPKTRRQPAVPVVALNSWRGLLAAPDQFNRLAPWEWMRHSQVVGLRHPITKEVWLASVLGRLRCVLALLVYRNEAGHRWLLNTILNQGDPAGFKREDSAFELGVLNDPDGAVALGIALQDALT